MLNHMVKHKEEQLNLVLKALSDPTRRAILSKLARGERGVSELALPFQMSLAAISKHLKVLEAAQFVQKTKHGRNFTCRANLKPLSAVKDLLEELGSFWRMQLDALDMFVAEDELRKVIIGEKNGRKRGKNGHSKGSR